MCTFIQCFILESSPVNNYRSQQRVSYAVLEVKRVAFLIDAVEEERVFFGEVSTEEEPG